VETAVPARVYYLSVPCLRVGGERGGDGGGPRSRNGFGSPQRSHAEGEGRDKALQAAGAVQRYRLVERVMQGRPSVVVAPLVPPAARGEAIMPPGGACSSAPDCDSRTAIHRQRPLRRCALRLRRPCYALDCLILRTAQMTVALDTAGDNTYPAACPRVSAGFPNSDAMPRTTAPASVGPDPGRSLRETLPHLTTFDTTARIASVYFDNATALLRPIEAIPHSVYTLSHPLTMVHVVFCFQRKCLLL
jgi:hypothetical protein